ncbi:hypothetical protein H6G13_01315 [Pseudanabaena sp. FACHB-2040]|nr:hypothetical protein [Pseudanabaena sp. FACHB-2040]
MKFSKPVRFVPQVSLAALALLVSVSVVTASTPSLRILALEFIQVFQRTRSDQVGPQNVLEADQAQPLSEEMIQEAERRVRTTTTVSEMEAERGFDLKEPTYLPSGFELQEVGSPYPEVVAINYENSQTGDRLFVTQQRLDGDSPVVGPIVLIPSAAEREDYNFSIMWSDRPLFDDDPALAGGSPIGASAKTTPIQIGNVVGEYVEGTWQEVVASNGVMQGMQWVQDTNFRQVQWQEGEILFQVFSPNAMSQEELTEIARGLR